MQENWIGRSEGARVRFAHASAATSRWRSTPPGPDTLFGASFVGIAPDHPLAAELAASDPELAAFIAECRKGGTSEAEIETAEKMGFDTGLSVSTRSTRHWSCRSGSPTSS